jgi:outer membrane protein OmpA-like peptidoglycan-associated protein
VTRDSRGRRLLVPLEREPEQETAPEPERAPVARSPLLDLQRRMGNTAMSRQLARDPATDAARAVAEAELAMFMSHHWSKESFKPSTGGGLFDVDYDPAAGEMVATVRIAFKFQTGNIMNPKWLTAIGGFAALATKGFKAEDFIWTEEEKTAWRTSAVSEIQNVWSQRYTFFTKKPYWEGLPPVDVRVVIADAPEDGDHDKKAQWVVTVDKWPDDAGLEEAMSWPSDRSKNQSTGHLEESSRDAGGITTPDVRHYSRSTGTRKRYGQVDTDNPTPILFAQGKADVSAADATALQKFGATLGAPDMPPFPVTVTGRASSEGQADRNQSLSEDRARNVSNEIVKGGAQVQPTSESKGADGATLDPAWRRVDIVVGTFESDQHTVAHEFGHMLGLDDEYPTADPKTAADPPGVRPVGGAPTHAALVQSLMPGQQPVQARHNDNIMSNGEVVRPHHYVTLLEALGTTTGTTGLWDIAPASLHGPGDFPTPVLRPDGTATA